MGIGPELPPHLQQATAGPQLPASTTPASAGPQRPPTAASAGPQLPPGFAAGPSAPAPVADDDSDDDYVPDLPPDLLAARKSGPAAGPSTPRPTVLGPTLPPGLASAAAAAPSPASAPKRETPLSNYYSDDDDFGPMPLPAGARVEEESEGVRLFREREEREKEKERKAQEGKGKMVREEWMLVPPKEMDLLSTMDPTKLKSRTFQNSAQLSTAASKKGASSGPNLWTETPQERMQRLEDEMMGRKRKAEVSAGGGGHVEEESDDQRRKRMRDMQLKEEVERHNAASRNASLLDQHSKSGAKGKNKKDGEKEVPGIWDRDRDMSIGGRLMDDAKRADAVKSAKELGGRFGGGSFL